MRNNNFCLTNIKQKMIVKKRKIMPGYEQIGNFIIELDAIYYLAYAGGSRELPSKQQKEWEKTNNLPGLLQVKERNKLGMQNNPNVIPLKGRDLLMFIKELKFMPFFDRAFNNTHLVKLTDVVIFESIKSKVYTNYSQIVE
jgi:hypothetical protein